MALLFSLSFDRIFFYIDMSQNQNQGNVQGDDKKKEKSPMTWHGIVCDGSEKKNEVHSLTLQYLHLNQPNKNLIFWKEQ